MNNKGNKGTKEAMKEGKSIESSDNTIIDLANEGEKNFKDYEGKSGCQKLYAEPPDFSSVTCIHSREDYVCFGPELAPKLKLVRKSNLRTLIQGCERVSLNMFNCKECKICRQLFQLVFKAMP